MQLSSPERCVPRRAAVCLALCFLLLPAIAFAQAGWHTQTLPSLPEGQTYSLSAIQARTGSEVWLAGGVSTGEAVVLKTLDGSTWNIVYRKGADSDSFVSMSGFTSLSVADASHAWVGGLWGSTSYTSDGGASWRHDASSCADPVAPGGTAAHGYGMKAVSATDVWFVGWDPWDMAGQIWHRPFSGNCNDWGYYPYRLEAQYGYATVLAIDAADASNAWAVGYPGIVHTTDGGANWVTEVASPGGLLRGVAVASATVAWAVGDGGLVLKTANGGTTWVVQGAGVAASLRSVAAVSTSVAWAVGDGGTIVKTIDGGATWRSQASGLTEVVNLIGVTAIDANTAWALTDQQTVLHVSDGGVNEPLSAPAVSRLVPAGAPVAGGTTGIEVYGTGFLPGARVSLGGTAAVGVTYVSSGELSITAPAHAAGIVDVTVTNPDGQAATAVGAFAFAASQPWVTRLTPSYGYLQTQLDLDISGAGFTPDEQTNEPVPTVTVNGTPITASWATYGEAHVTVPWSALQPIGLVNVTVTTAGGTSNAATFAVNYGTVSVNKPGTGSPDASVSVPTLSGTAQASFYGLTYSGWVRVAKVFENPLWVNSVSPAPTGYAFLPTYYYLADTYSSMHFAAVTMCFPYLDADLAAASLAESRLRLLRFDESQGAWVDTTFTLDSANNVLCGTANGVGYFALAQGPVSMAAPTISGVTPALGSPSGGTAITIAGANFQPNATVTIGSVSATSVTIVNGRKITAVAPAHSLGVWDVVVTNPDAQAATLASGFEYQAAPSVTSITPAQGRQGGYTSVTITGARFRPGLTVRFGGTAMSSYSVVDATTITGSTPSHAAGVVDLVVTNADGQSGTLAGGYTYVAAPTVSSVSPSTGSTAGGTSVTIAGTGFQAGATVTFGGTAGTSVSVANSTSITAVTPAHAAGVVNVVVTNTDTQNGTLGLGFTYAAPPAPTSVSPGFGPTTGATAITITGTGFASGATVTIGGVAATSVVVVGATSITAVSPAHAPGAADLVVTSSGGVGGTLAGGFTYMPRGMPRSDFDGDHKADVSVYRPSSGTWFSLDSSTANTTFASRGWGVEVQGDVPVRGDFDGDGKLDPTVFRPASGSWFILESHANFTTWSYFGWGNATDTLMPADYDGDGKTDAAVYRSSTGTWYVRPSGGGSQWSVAFGSPGDIPIEGDFDGDGKADVAVYRPSTGTWFWVKSSTNFTAFDYRGWGVQAQGDVPVPGDYDGDGTTDLCVFRPGSGTWFVLESHAAYSTWSYFGWGSSTDTLVPADYDGDGKTDGAVYRPSTGTWYIKPSSGASQWSVVFGQTGDVPLQK
jgi:hypothetical protein